MSLRTFLVQLALLTFLAAAVLGGLHASNSLPAQPKFLWAALFLFVALSILMFVLGKRTAAGRNKSAFISVAIGFTLLKLVFCVAIAVAYRQAVPEASKLFALLFLGIYVVYTIFETHLLMKIGAVKS